MKVSVTQFMSDSVTPWTVARQAPLSMGFSRQEYWGGLPFPSPGDLPDPDLLHCGQMLYPDLRYQGSPLYSWGLAQSIKSSEEVTGESKDDTTRG